MKQGVEQQGAVGAGTFFAAPEGFLAARYHNEPRRVLLASYCTGKDRAEPAGPVAAGAECDAFRLWVEGLPPAGHQSLVQLREWGFTYDLAGLRAELARALQAVPPGPGCGGVVRRLLGLLARLPGAVCFLLEEARSGR
jgi:hypothetical protein